VFGLASDTGSEHGAAGSPSSVTIPLCTVYGRTHIPGQEPGRRVRLRGMVGIGNYGRPTMINPAYDLLG